VTLCRLQLLSTDAAMLFVPQAPMDPINSEFGAMSAVYPNSVASIGGHMFPSLNPEEQGADSSLAHHCPSMVDWAPTVCDRGLKVPSSVSSKALTIRNPKTGEVIGPDKPRNKVGALTLAAKAKWQEEAAKVLARRAGSIKWCADHSTFSALNIEGVVSPAGRSPMNRSVIDEALKKSAKGSLLLNRKLRQSKKVAAITVSSLEPGLSRHVERGNRSQATVNEKMEQNSYLESEATLTRLDKPLPAAQEDINVSPEEECSKDKSMIPEETTSAAESQPSLQESSDTASGEGSGEERSSSKVTIACSSANAPKPTSANINGNTQKQPVDFFAPKARKQRKAKCISPLAAVDGSQSTPDEAVEQRGVPQPESEVSSSKDQYSCSALLGWRHLVVNDEVPCEIETLTARDGPPCLTSIPSRLARADSLEASTPKTDEASDRALFGSMRARDRSHNSLCKTQSTNSLPTPSPKAYRPSMGVSSLPRLEELKRNIQSLLNKICPESVVTIGEKIAEIKVESADELEYIISLIFKKALSEPHYCETYADLIFSINSSFGQFASPTGGKPLTFKSTLLNICQNEFESLPNSLNPTQEEIESYDSEELEFRRKKTKDRVLANMKLIGHLFLRQLISAKVISSVIQELIQCDNADVLPEEHVIECVVELLMSIGYTLESMAVGKASLSMVCGRLLDLKQRKRKDGRGVYCKRIQFAIQDLLDVRCAGWTKKIFGGIAKTKEEIRLEQHRELAAQAHGKEVESGKHIVAGQRPLYILAKKKDEHA